MKNLELLELLERRRDLQNHLDNNFGDDVKITGNEEYQQLLTELEDLKVRINAAYTEDSDE